jgi:hypothetical protein
LKGASKAKPAGPSTPDLSTTTGATSPDAAALYDTLDKVIIPLYTNNRQGFIDVMSHAIALNGSFFNTQHGTGVSLESLLSLRKGYRMRISDERLAGFHR